MATAGAEHFNGFAGEDEVDYAGSVRALERGAGFDGDARGDSYVDIENLSWTHLGGILIGDNGQNRLFGRDGHDILQGLGGRDVLEGGHGENQLFGGRGRDTLTGGQDHDQFFGAQGRDTIILNHALPDLAHAGKGNDKIIVLQGTAHQIDGGEGQDVLDLRGFGVV
ncbi:MAG: calcium-binding protein [Sedimentitalea sp.]